MQATLSLVEHENTPPCSQPLTALAFLKVLGAFCNTPFASASEAIDTALTIVMQHVGVRTAFLSHIGIGQLDVLAAEDNQGCGIPVGAIVPLENSFCQYVRATDAPVVIPDATLDARVLRVGARLEFNIVAYIGVPIHLCSGELYGTLCALDPEPRAFAPEHVELMRVLAQRLASLIEQEQLEEQTERVQRESETALASASKALDQQAMVMSVIAHDLRTPLTSMRGFVDLMINDVFGPVWPKQREALDRVRANLQWMQRLSNDIIDVTAIDTKNFAMITSEYKPGQIAQNVVDLCQIQARDQGLQLHYAGGGGISPVVGDADRMQQVLINLVGNALRYTERGEVTVQVQAHAEGVEFRVTDTGPGIPIEKQEAIWQRGVRGCTVGRGTGLGLYVVKQLVAAMHGTVGLESQPGQPSTFWVRIPTHGPAPHATAWA